MSESQTRKQNILNPDSDIRLAILLYIVLLKQRSVHRYRDFWDTQLCNLRGKIVL